MSCAIRHAVEGLDLRHTMSTVKRNIFYFKDQAPDGGTNFYEKAKRVHDLVETQREFDCGDGNTCNFWYTNNENLLIGTVELIRYISPSIRTRGTNHSSTVKLANNQGVNEKAHFIFNPVNATFAFEYNHFGPKIGLLYRMVNQLYESNFDEALLSSAFAYVSAGTALERLDASYGVRTVQIRYAPAGLGDNTDANSTLNQSINAVRKFGNAKTLDITFKGEPYSKGILFRSREFISKFLPHGDQSLQNFEKLEVKVQKNATGGVEVIDFFKDKMLSELQAVKIHEQTREIDSNDFHQKMLRDMRDRDLA